MTTNTGQAAAHPTAAHVARVPQAANGDDMLAALHASCDRRAYLGAQSTPVLRQALDLCGEDAQGLGRAALINGILASF